MIITPYLAAFTVAFGPPISSLSTPSKLPFKRNNHGLNVRGGSSIPSRSQLNLLSPTTASVLAGSVAGAIGIGVAFPLDTLKTKSQVLAQQGTTASLSLNGKETMSMNVGQMNMFQLIKYIFEMEGLSGFFGGVKGMMVGQALIKSVAFSANQFGLDFLKQHLPALPSVCVLLSAACFAGFVTSFLVTPIERIKIMLQASNAYENEFDCLNSVMRNDGLQGLLLTGLAPTLVREIPSYGIYFLVYGVFMQTQIATSLGNFAPLVFGALSGMAAWLPVYPVDVVKTLVQNSDGKETYTSFEVTKKLYQEGGVGAFFDGLTPKMLRAAVNHAVCFFVYDIMMDVLVEA